MSDVLDLTAIGARIRNAREDRGIPNLNEFANRVAELSEDRPSVAKLSRIETGEQPVPPDILRAVAKLTEIPITELRPDLAELMRAAE